MANISSLLNTIKNAVYGRDMRGALHDSIKAVNDDVETKEPKITEGTISQYWRGNKTFADFGTSVRDTILTGLSTLTNSAITISDNVIIALGKLQAQITACKKQDEILQQNIDTEAKSRQTADNTLQQSIDTEVSARQTADIILQNNIDTEILERKKVDTTLDGRVIAVEEKAHIHENKTVLDGISEANIEHWNGILEQVTQTQLDAVKVYLEDMCFGFTDEFQRIYGALGVSVYDGGIFGMAQNEIALDGGSFDEEPVGTVDCGGWEPITVNIGTGGTVIDGGTFDTVTGEVIDGGTY